MTKIIQTLNWRYATKNFDPQKKISPNDLNDLLESLRLAPSCFNIQPWKFIQVTSQNLRQQLRKAAYDQPQFTDASDLIVLTVPSTVDISSYIIKLIDLTAHDQGVDVSALEGYKKMISGFIESKLPVVVFDWSCRQLYLALGFMLFAAAAKEIDTAPMEGFSQEQFDQILDLNKLGLKSVVAVALGYRLSTDPASSRPKVRFPLKDVVVQL